MTFPVQMNHPDSATVRSARRPDIDNAKALAILFVVIGHISIASGPNWALNIRFLIYNFHMPLFMYLSGYVFFLHTMKHGNQNTWLYARARAKRLLGLFAVMGFIVVNIKYLTQDIGSLNRAYGSYFEGYKHLIFETQKSPSLDLWYLVVLFIFSVFTYASFKLDRLFLYIDFLIGFALYALFAATETRGGLTDDFYFSRICWFYVFFMLGCVASANWVHLEMSFKRLWPLGMLGLVFAEWAAYVGTPIVGSGWRFLICGIFSILSIHGLWLGRSTRMQPFLNYISANTLIIYLLNTIFIASSMIILQHLFDVRNNMGIAYLILTPLGLFMPCMVRSFAKRNRLTSWIIPYIS